MAAKANLKKYLAVDGKWQFVPILKTADGKLKPSTVLIGGKPVQGTTGTFYVEWREVGNIGIEPDRPFQKSLSERMATGIGVPSPAAFTAATTSCGFSPGRNSNVLKVVCVPS